MYRVLFVSGRLPRSARPSQTRRIYRTEIFGLRGESGDESARYGKSPEGSEGRIEHRLLQHYEVLHNGLSRKYYDNRQRDYSAQRARGR